MKMMGIAELKAQLSETLARVKAGEEVTVTEHGRPIARIVPLGAGTPVAATQDLVRSGILRAPEKPLDETFWKLQRPSARPAGEPEERQSEGGEEPADGSSDGPGYRYTSADRISEGSYDGAFERERW